MKRINLFLLRALLFSFIFIAIVAIYLGLYIYQQELKFKNKIYPNVYVDNINFGGSEIKDVENYFFKKNKKIEKVKIILNFKDEIATFSGSILKIKYDSTTLAKHANLIGRSPATASRIYQKLVTIFNLGRFNFEAKLDYDQRSFEDYLTYLEENYGKPAENALFNFESGRVTAFKIEKNGLKIRKEKALTDLKTAIFSLKPDQKKDLKIIVEDEVLKPEITLASSNNFGIVEKIAEGKSDYSGSIPERVHNVLLASSKFNGVLIPKDHVFSFNDTVGDISASTGYKPAYVIKNGRTVLGDGGGVCQVSTTLFRAALNSGLPIVERTAHAYRVHYYENDMKPGFDATVFGPTVDLKFKNDTLAYILIQTEVIPDRNILIFHLYGKKDDRKIYISEAKLCCELPPPAPLNQEDPTLKRGVTKQVDWSAWGAKSVFHYKVEKSGQITQDRDFVSVFRPWQAVFLVGTAD